MPFSGSIEQLDPDRLRELFAQGPKRTEAAKLRNDIGERIKKMVQLNKTRTSYLEHFQRLIDEYNAGSMNVNAFFEQLVTLTQALDAEEHRAISERLTEEELAIVDLITNRGDTLTEQERAQVKKVAQALVIPTRRETRPGLAQTPASTRRRPCRHRRCNLQRSPR